MHGAATTASDVLTGMNPDGTVGMNCGDFTMNSSIYCGSPNGTAGAFGGTITCVCGNVGFGFYCFGTDHDTPGVAPTPTAGRLAFGGGGRERHSVGANPSLASPLTQTADGTTYVADLAFTGSRSPSSAGIAGTTWSDWTSASAALLPTLGRTGFTDEWWGQPIGDNCSMSFRLYCLQQ